jgi:peptide/nickel transport system substrate-binding protein
MDIARLGADSRSLVLGYNGKIEQFTRSPLRPRARASAMRWMFNSLLRFDEKIGLVGDLAESWSRSADGRVLTFKLRRAAVWHDGKPVTSDDVLFTARLLQQPTRYFHRTLHLWTGEPAVFSAPDAYTARVETPRPYACLPAYLTATWASLFLIVPRHVVEQLGEAAYEASPVGSGPFRFGAITDDGHAVLPANERYFGGAPRVDRAILRLFERGQDRIDAFKRGELDLVVAPGRKMTHEEAARYSSRLEAVPSCQIVQFAMNGRHPILKSVRVRQAIAAAVDRVKHVRDIEGPEGLPAFSPVGPTSWAFEPNVQRHPHDPARARRLLAEEGWSTGPDGVLRKGDQRLCFDVRFVPDTWNVDYAGYAEAIRRDLAAVGIDLVVNPVEYWSGMKPAWRDHDFAAFMYYDTFYNEPDLYWSWHSSMPKRPNGPDAPAGLPQYGYGVTGYANARVDELVIAARETIDMSERRAQLGEAQKIMADEVASLWLYNYPYRNLVHERLKGTSVPSLADGTADLICTLYPERLYKS